MLFSRMIGDVKVSNLIEYYGPTHDPARVFPDLDMATSMEQAKALGPEQYCAEVNRFIIAIQLWIVQIDQRTLLIDTGVGNRKVRTTLRQNMLNTLVPEWMASLGVTAASVTHVINTHLHSDHVGWNTELIDGQWRPTFPNAEYFLPLADFEPLARQYANGNKDAGGGSFADSVLPVVDAGKVNYIDGTGRIADLLDVEPIPGHTPGQVSLRLSSGGKEGIFTADTFHSPIQIVQPNINTTFCMDKQLAIQSRRAVLARAAERSALIMPCHFGYPHCGYVVKGSNDQYGFLPEDRTR
jgi:glyoxylase-like metal-dependent hydrolase (beta-lactamase superfamily II)